MLVMSWAQWALFTIIWTQLVIILVTVYFHRTASHLAVELPSGMHRIFRFLSWFMIAMVPREFAAVHRKHHATCDTPSDPHSPVHYGVWTVLFKGLSLYRKEAASLATIEKYGKGLPLDPWESFYSKHKNLGILLQLALLVAFFGGKGGLTWVCLMLWIPFWAAGVVNGLGHHFGYRRFATDDHSTNLFPFGVWIGGEELHNNHHAYPSSAKFSHAWFELDIGFGVIKLLCWMGLARLRQPVGANSQEPADRAFGRLLRDRYSWQKRLHASFDCEIGADLRQAGVRGWRQIARWTDHAALGKSAAATRLQSVLKAYPRLLAFHASEVALARLWKERLSPINARAAMEDWLARAKQLKSPAVDAWCLELIASH
jgi:fatty-acid desaturase